MTPADWIAAAVAALTVVIVPILVLLIRGAIKWTRTEDKLGTLIDTMKELIIDKDKVHSEMLAQMRIDREATDKRLRFIEEFWMRKGYEKQLC